MPATLGGAFTSDSVKKDYEKSLAKKNKEKAKERASKLTAKASSLKKTKTTTARDGFIIGYDYSKFPHKNSAVDNRKGAIMADLLNFTPYEKGYCFLAVMSYPKFMIAHNKNNAREMYNQTLLENFRDIIEQEFIGLSGIEDMTLGTTDISDNRTNTPVVTKNERGVYTTIDTTYTEQSGLPLTKFLEQYTTLLYDPYAQVKTYGGRLRTPDGTKFMKTRGAGSGFTLKNDLYNETFNLLYVITDNTALLVEKAFILYNAQPMNVSYSSLFNMNKFEFSTQAINLSWNCLVLDGKIVNRLGQIYIRDLMEAINVDADPLGTISIRGGQIHDVVEELINNKDGLDASRGRWATSPKHDWA